MNLDFEYDDNSMICQKYEIICGFRVKLIPQKPDYLPISQEEFVDRTLEAWTQGDKNARVSAVFHGGEREWAALWNDESYSVRGAAACFASEEYQLKLVSDPITQVRDRLAVYGTDRVRLALMERGEDNENVLINIAKYGSASIRRRLVDMAWEQPLVLIKCATYLPASCVEKLMGHPDTDVRVHAALHGTRDQCSRVLVLPESMDNLAAILMRSCLIDRIQELNAVENAINFGKAITRNNQEMELST